MNIYTISKLAFVLGVSGCVLYVLLMFIVPTFSILVGTLSQLGM